MLWLDPFGTSISYTEGPHTDFLSDYTSLICRQWKYGNIYYVIFLSINKILSNEIFR